MLSRMHLYSQPHQVVISMFVFVTLLCYGIQASNTMNAKFGISAAQESMDGLSESRSFGLRQIYYRDFSQKTPVIKLLDISATDSIPLQSHGRLELIPALRLKSQSMKIAKMSTSNTHIIPECSLSGSSLSQCNEMKPGIWTIETVKGPNLTDRETLINLAKMTSDAYIKDPSHSDWLNVTNGFNSSGGFGWQDDGLRGHVFANENNSTVIISYKGTSIDPREKWSSNDKLNDNLLFSCCCATQRPDPYWYGQVCDCRTDTYKCNSTCLTQELMRKNKYYISALQVYYNVTKMYPNANIWATGHSMGGAMASLIGLTFNIPAVTFESPPQAQAAQRLGLEIHPDPLLNGGFHFGNTADPVYMGACHGLLSSCALAGLAFETQCFTGQRCVYDTVGDKGWRLSITNHRINYVIPYVLEAYDTVANCATDTDCVDCYEWYFDSGNFTRH